MYQHKKLVISFTSLLLLSALSGCGESNKAIGSKDENNVSINSLVEQELKIVNNAGSTVFATSLKSFLQNSKLSSLSSGKPADAISLNSDLLTFMVENSSFSEVRASVLANKVSFSGRVNGVKCSIDFDLQSGSQMDEAICG
jgi:hypothetical protein